MSEAKGNTEAVAAAHGEHDRVAMLSLRADGSPDQVNPEIIGDREFAEAATREQFRQQAVSAADTAERGPVRADTAITDAPEDPTIQALQDAHESAAKQAESAADATVSELFTDDPALTAEKPAAASVSTPTSTTGKASGATSSK